MDLDFSINKIQCITYADVSTRKVVLLFFVKFLGLIKIHLSNMYNFFVVTKKRTGSVTKIFLTYSKDAIYADVVNISEPNVFLLHFL